MGISITADLKRLSHVVAGTTSGKAAGCFQMQQAFLNPQSTGFTCHITIKAFPFNRP